jgi:hypothetical protein
MASIVQSKSAASAGAATSFSTLPTVGNLIVVFQFKFSTIAVPTDNQGNTYTEIIERNDALSDYVSASYTKVVTSSGTFTITPPASTGMFMMEISGWDGTTVLDGSATSAAHASTAAPWTMDADTNITTSISGSLFLTALMDETSDTFTSFISGYSMNELYKTINGTGLDSNYVWSYSPRYPGTFTPTIYDSSTGNNAAVMVCVAIKGLKSTGELLDNFNDNSIDTGNWPNNFTYGDASATYAETGGEAKITFPTAGTGSGAGFQSALLDATNSFAYVKVTEVGSVSTNAKTMLVLELDSNNSVQIVQRNGSLHFYKYVAGIETDVVSAITYNSSTHAWWRIRENSGTTYWDTSSDGVTWTNMASTANPIAMTSVKIGLYGTTYQAETSPGIARFDNVNMNGPFISWITA